MYHQEQYAFSLPSSQRIMDIVKHLIGSLLNYMTVCFRVLSTTCMT